MSTANNVKKLLLFKALGLAVCILPVSAAIFTYFPLWASRRDNSVLSGVALVLFFMALVPLYKYVGKALKSPSAHTLWFIVFAAFFLLSKIADEMTVISFVGFISNLAGSFIFKLADRYKNGRREE